MAYVFYSEASSARNSPRDQRQFPMASRQQRRGQNGPASGSGIREGVYFGTGRFYEENLRNEQQRQREREQQQQTPRYSSSDTFYGLNGSEFPAGGDWSEDEWGRVFVEALRRVQEKRQQGRGSGGDGDGGLGMGVGNDALEGGLGQQGLGTGEEIRFEDLCGGVFGSTGSGRRGGGGGGISFEEVFGPSGNLPGGAGYSTGFGFGGQEHVRRGGAGMTWAEYMELFRRRYDGGTSYGYAGGPPPADLFDRWHTDW
ncbi:hypothetical protein CI238_08730 [Colletotrichum incanum]|uniref:Uncharacterized protein n=1 Tax=Colletotrichum incanum TaxID=1573173 RepID=A0A162Q0Y1_COLIC|nr:hypothetical protein CI238_08730 [Colletotrichum incanum]